MDKIKVSSLGSLDEVKFKKIALDRDSWISSGENMNYDYNYEVNNYVKNNYPLQTYLVLKKIIKENDKYVTLLFQGLNGENLPSFRAGQKIAITFSLDDKYVTRPFSLSSHPAAAEAGEYRITLSDSDDEVIHYMYSKMKIGERVVSSFPFGDFYFNGIRDSKNVIAIVSQDGIIPIYSMMQAILAGTEDFNITLFYSEKKYEDFLFIDDLLEFEKQSSKIRINLVLSSEERDGCLSGFVTCEEISKLLEDKVCSFFISGGEGLLKYLNKELEGLKLPKKYVRYDYYLPKCNIKKVVEYKLAIYIGDEKYEVACYNNKTIMKSLEEAGVFIPSRCHNGSCGFCQSELVKGKVKIVNDKRNEMQKEYNIIHPCITYPQSDIEIIVR